MSVYIRFVFGFGEGHLLTTTNIRKITAVSDYINLYKVLRLAYFQYERLSSARVLWISARERQSISLLLSTWVDKSLKASQSSLTAGGWAQTQPSQITIYTRFRAFFCFLLVKFPNGKSCSLSVNTSLTQIYQQWVWLGSLYTRLHFSKRIRWFYVFFPSLVVASVPTVQKQEILWRTEISCISFKVAVGHSDIGH